VTFCLAFGDSEGGVVAADTRSRLVDFGSAVGAEPELKEQRDDEGKLYPLADGWLTSASAMMWTGRILSHVSGPKTVAVIRAAILKTIPDMAILEQRSPERARYIRDRYSLLLVGPATAGFEASGLDWRGADAYGLVGPGQVIACGPLGVDVDAQTRLLKQYEARLREADLVQVIRETAALIHAIYLLGGPTGKVSDRVEIGIVTRDGSRYRHWHVPPTDCGIVLSGADEQLSIVEIDPDEG